MKLRLLPVLLASFIVLSGVYGLSPSPLKILVLDVGDGSAVLIRDPSGSAALYLGTSDFARVPERLKALGISRISLLISAHLTPTNAGPLRKILNTMEPETFTSAPFPYPILDSASSLKDLRNTIYYRQKMALTKFEPTHTQTYPLGFSVVTTIPVTAPSSSVSTPNPIIRVQFWGFSMFVLGTASADTEQALMTLFPGKALPADLLIISGDTGEPPSLPFLRAVSPRMIIASVSGTPPSASPSYALLARAASAGIPLARTDHLGSLTIASWGNGFRLYDKYGALSLNSPHRRMPLVLP